MSQVDFRDATRPEPDLLLTRIADYVSSEPAMSPLARETARFCLLDTLGCGIQALRFPECTKLLGPVVPGASLPGGARVPGTSYELDPITAAFNIGALIRWLDFNDTWLAAEWGHPSDNLGAILAVTDYLGRRPDSAPVFRGMPDSFGRYTVGDILTAMIQAHEIQGVLALDHAFNRVGLDHVLLVRIASAAVATRLLGGSREEIVAALSNAWVDGGALRTYRHAPNTGTRKSWAAGDASARGVRLALLARAGEMAYPSALTAREWGFQDVLFDGREIRLERELGSYVMENVLFKISYPAEFHAQTAVEAALRLHGEVARRLDEIERIEIETQEAALRIIDKTGVLSNPADRDHCLQYMVAVALAFGRLTADDYQDSVASDARIDRLRGRMHVRENPDFSRDYLDPDKRAIGNALKVFFADGSSTERVAIEFPLGHARRREEGIPKLLEKFRSSLAAHFPAERVADIERASADQAEFEALSVQEFMDLWTT